MFSSDSDYDSNYSDDEEEGRYHEEEEEEEEGVERAEPTEIVDYEMDFDDLDKDVLGDDDGADSDNEFKPIKKKKKQGKKEEESFMLFDFRRGENRWPENTELIDSKKAKELHRKVIILFDKI